MIIKGRQKKGDEKGIDKGIENLKNEIKRRHRWKEKGSGGKVSRK